jgi:hypothetical protein
MSEKDVKVYYKIFTLLENGQIDTNCIKSGWCYSSSAMSKIDIEVLLDKFWGKGKYKTIITKII